MKKEIETKAAEAAFEQTILRFVILEDKNLLRQIKTYGISVNELPPIKMRQDFVKSAIKKYRNKFDMKFYCDLMKEKRENYSKKIHVELCEKFHPIAEAAINEAIENQRER